MLLLQELEVKAYLPTHLLQDKVRNVGGDGGGVSDTFFFELTVETYPPTLSL